MSELAVVIMIVIFVVTGTLSWAGTGVVRWWLLARKILDQPNARSSHAVPVPRGGGIAVMVAITVVMVLLMGSQRSFVKEFGMILGVSLLLAGISFWDDLRGLPAWLRLLSHGAAVVAGISALPDTLVFQGILPEPLDRIIVAGLWVWFINLYNFMDGIDGLAALETIAIASGIVIVSVLAGTGMPVPAVAIAGAAAGFLLWNFPPAKIFLGDVGSVALGYLLGYLLLVLASHGAVAAAVILPMYYVVDATITLLRRFFRGEKIWQAHREHAYQKAVIQGSSHGAVVGQITLCNVFLVGLASLTIVTSTRIDLILVGFALGLSVILWRHLCRQRR